MVKIVSSEYFERIIDKIDISIRLRLDKLINKIVENPDIGKPMRYDRKDTRELYLGSFRLSYLYDKNKETIYLIDLYHKDEQ